MVLKIAWSSYGAAVALTAYEHHGHQLGTGLVKTLVSGNALG